MSEQGESIQPELQELKLHEGSNPNSLILDVKGERPAVEQLIKDTLYEIRAREFPPLDEAGTTKIKDDIEDRFYQQESDIDAFFNGGKPYNKFIGTNWELRVYIGKDKDNPGCYRLSFNDNQNGGRVKAEGLSVEHRTR